MLTTLSLSGLGKFQNLKKCKKWKRKTKSLKGRKNHQNMLIKSVPIGLKRDHAEKIGNENDKLGCKHPHFTSMNVYMNPQKTVK